MKPRTLKLNIASIAPIVLLAGTLMVSPIPATDVAYASDTVTAYNSSSASTDARPETDASPDIDFTSAASIDGKTQTLYTSQNGLPSTVATAIAQTSEGFIWIGGYEGLTYFDGQVFEFQKEAPDFSVSSLLADDNGALWIGTSNQGLYRYVDGNYSKVDCSTCGKDFNEVSCISDAPNGYIVMGTEHGIAYASSDSQVNEVCIENLPDTIIRSIAVSDSGEMMAVSQDGHLFFIGNNKAAEIVLSNATGTPRCVSFDLATHRFYVGTDRNDVCTFSPDGIQQSSFEIDGANCINSVNISSDGVAWICSDNGIHSYQNGKSLKQNLQIDNSIDSMLVDFEGNYWFASSRQGVLLVANTPFKDISTYTGMSPAVVNAIVEYDGVLLAGTDNGAVVIDPKSDSITYDPRFQELDSLRVRDFKIDRNGFLWAATANGGVLRMSKDGKWTAYTKDSSNAINSNNFRCLYEADSAMIAGGEEGAVIITEDDVRNVVENPGALNSRVMSISQIGDMLILGTDSYGLQLVKNGDVIGSITTKNGLSSNSIMKIFTCSNKENLILSTGSGLVKINLNTSQASENFNDDLLSASTIEDFPASNTLDIIRQDDNTVWVAAGNGIYRTSEASLIGSEPFTCKLFTRQDGLPYDITANSTQYIDGNMLYLCGTGGVGALNMKEAAEITDSCIPSVSGAYADGQFIPVSADNTITIPANAERVRIMAHATTFDKTNITLFYKLEGYDSHECTTPLSNFNGIEYTNVAGGTYHLNFGAWDEAAQTPLNSTSVTIKKEYGLLDHPITRVAGVAFILCVIGLLLVWRRRRISNQLQREYEEKERRALEKMAYSDFLTDAYNRNYLNKWTEAAHNNAYRFPICLITVDLNNLKLINDTKGHLAGDEYLKRTTNAIHQAFGKDNATVIRLGGDEFLVITEGLEPNTASQLIKRAHTFLFESKADEPRYSFSYGMVTIENAEFSLDEKLRIADKQMMEAKRKHHENHNRRKSER